MTLGFGLKQLGGCHKFYLDWEGGGMNGFVEQVITECSVLDILRLRYLTGFHGFRNLELTEMRFVVKEY